MRGFNFTSYVTPDDPKRQRTESYGKIRTEATTPDAIARDLLVDLPDATLLSVDGGVDGKNPSQNKLQLAYAFVEPCLSSVLVEMQEVEEEAVHPLSQEGFIAWAKVA